MSYIKNRSVAFPAAVQATITNALNDALNALNGVIVVTLERDERKTIPNVEENRLPYVHKAVNEFGDSYPNLVKELNDRATDAQHNLSNTTYNYTLDMYHEAQRYQGDLPGADVIVQELKPLFEDQGAAKSARA